MAAGLALPGSIWILGCVASPEIRPDVVGIDDLARQTRYGPDEGLPSATILPRIPRWMPGGDPSQAVASTRAPYLVGPLDKLIVIVWGRPDLGSQVAVGFDGDLRASTVREDGTIVLPFTGPIQVGGKSVAEIRGLVADAYAKIIENPQAEVSLHSCGSRWVQLGGDVEAPGTYYLCEGRQTIGEVLSAARGFKPSAHLGRGVLTRQETAYRVDYREGEKGHTVVADVLLEDGDRLFFPSLNDRYVYVFGEVKAQGVFKIPEEGLTVLNVLGQARGPDFETFKDGGVFLMRPRGGETVAYQIAFAELLKGPDLQVADGDRIFVATSSLKKWARWWEQALPFLRISVVGVDLTD